MRFALKTLSLLVLFFALHANVFVRIHHSRLLMAETATLRAVTDDRRTEAEFLERQIESQREAVKIWKSQLAECSAAEQRIQSIFDGLVAEESRIETRVNQVSVREVPIIHRSPNYRKEWFIHVPIGRALSLRLEYADRQRTPIRDSADFDSVEPISIRLSDGLNRVEFAAAVMAQEKPIEFALKINEEEVTRFLSLRTELTGWSS